MPVLEGGMSYVYGQVWEGPAASVFVAGTRTPNSVLATLAATLSPLSPGRLRDEHRPRPSCAFHQEAPAR